MKRCLFVALFASLFSPTVAKAHITPEMTKGLENNFSEIALDSYLSGICRLKKENNSNGNEEPQTRIAKELSKKRIEINL